jgi:hypothetical protein
VLSQVLALLAVRMGGRRMVGLELKFVSSFFLVFLLSKPQP